jgi:hypothetical protein
MRLQASQQFAILVDMHCQALETMIKTLVKYQPES